MSQGHGEDRNAICKIMLDRLLSLPFPAGAFIVFMPIVLLWLTKITITMHFTLPQNVIVSALLPLLLGFYIMVFLWCLGILSFSGANLLKVYLPLTFVTLLVTFVFTTMAHSYFIENGYSPVENQSFSDVVLGKKYYKN